MSETQSERTKGSRRNAVTKEAEASTRPAEVADAEPTPTVASLIDPFVLDNLLKGVEEKTGKSTDDVLFVGPGTAALRRTFAEAKAFRVGPAFAVDETDTGDEAGIAREPFWSNDQWAEFGLVILAVPVEEVRVNLPTALECVRPVRGVVAALVDATFEPLDGEYVEEILFEDSDVRFVLWPPVE